MNELAIRKRALNGDKLLGTFLNTGSPLLAEIASRSGMDWCQIDMEHGSGSWEALTHQLMAIEGSTAAPVIRIPSNNPDYFKRALDLGAHGIMIPNVNTAEEAQAAVSYSRYPPHGSRGVSILNRGAQFGAKFMERLETSHENVLVIAQIESPTALENVNDIADVDGVDVLFIGPMDLTVSLGIARAFDHPDFIEAKRKVVDAANRAGKACGILGFSPEDIAFHYDEGFNFIAVGSDGGMVANGMKALVAANKTARGD